MTGTPLHMARILENMRRAPLLCRECDGLGRIWGTRNNNPYERERDLGECDHCEGSGYEPEPEDEQ